MNQSSKYFVWILLIPTALVFIWSPKQGGFWWSDASRHAMDGAFFYEFFSDLPVFDPVDYTVDFYLRYPALSVLFYPPLFAISEGILFYLTGPSHFTAQLTVTIFFFFLMYGAYKLSFIWLPPIYAVSFILLFAGIHQVMFWGRQVMLEIPAYTFIIWTSYYLIQFVKSDRDFFLYLSAFLFVLGFYTKLNVIFIAPVFLLILYKRLNRELSRRKSFYLSIFGIAVLLSPLLYITLRFGHTNIGAVLGGQASGELDRFSVENWVYYLKEIPDQIGFVNMALVVCALGVLPKTYKKIGSDSILLPFFAGWFVWGYFFFPLWRSKNLGIPYSSFSRWCFYRSYRSTLPQGGIGSDTAFSLYLSSTLSGC